jgi:hypothetical protein
MGRSRNTALILVSQNAGDLLSEQVTNCISGVFAFRSSERVEVANVMALLGVEASDEHQIALRGLGNGECIFRDLEGRVGRIGIDLISDEMRQWLDTNPTHHRPGAEAPRISDEPVASGEPEEDAEPVAGQPSVPGARQQSTPGSGQLSAPGAGQPAAPVAGPPSTPGSGEPPAPQAAQPTAPEAAQPTAPEAAQPTAPEAAQPTAPAAAQPKAPAAGPLSTSGTGELLAAGAAQPSVPGTGPPSAPGAAQPSMPGQPSAPGTGAVPDRPADRPSAGEPAP